MFPDRKEYGEDDTISLGELSETQETLCYYFCQGQATENVYADLPPFINRPTTDEYGDYEELASDDESFEEAMMSIDRAGHSQAPPQ